jgi:hypothetical protein
MTLFRLALICAFALGACGAPAAAAPASGPNAVPGSATPASGEAAPTRTAWLHEIVNDVQSRPSESESLKPAADGDVLVVGGQARTGAGSTTRLDLTEGTIVRLAPNSQFTLTELTPDVAAPSTRLSLMAGQVFVILLGGSLEVATPVGAATVRGSYLGVAFDPATNHLTATCLEGACALKNDLGSTPLTDGQAAEITGTDQPPSPPRPMRPEEFQQWTTISPEARQLSPDGTPGVPGAPPPGGSPGPQPFGTPPAGGTPFPGGPGPVAHVNTQPLSYSFTNNCIFTQPDGTTKTLTWSISLSGPVSESFSLAAGESRSGELPPGQYTVTDSDSEGRTHSGTIDSDFGPLNITHCVGP